MRYYTKQTYGLGVGKDGVGRGLASQRIGGASGALHCPN